MKVMSLRCGIPLLHTLLINEQESFQPALSWGSMFQDLKKEKK